MNPLGKSIGFPLGVGADGRIRWSEGEDNIRESIAVILQTEMGERIALSDFGAGLGLFLFEPNNPATHVRMVRQIEESLRRWEPRIALDAVEVREDPEDASEAIATISYRLVATGAAERVSLSIRLGQA
ncbi:GPW/gp25 family protein [Sphingomonas sp. dw_22]|uniref:GPW/gp25 family protein n=1 Tax=Sphingomonas sp. dw_22 TaxID=2721175 RepID=UPI001BD611FD|nr:GPW/gp25 family protein [Sphingomonas sp. dw_22]